MKTSRLLVRWLVRQQVKDYVPVGFAEKRIEAEAQRQGGADFPANWRCRSCRWRWNFTPRCQTGDGIAKALLLSSHFFGLLWCGSLFAAVASLKRRGPAGEQLIDRPAPLCAQSGKPTRLLRRDSAAA